MGSTIHRSPRREMKRSSPTTFLSLRASHWRLTSPAMVSVSRPFRERTYTLRPSDPAVKCQTRPVVVDSPSLTATYLSHGVSGSRSSQGTVLLEPDE
jgi:hypothetical protein